MSSKSAFLSRSPFNRGDSPLLPLYSPTSKNRSDYDLSDMSPRAEDEPLYQDDHDSRDRPLFSRRSPPPLRHSGNRASTSSSSPSRKASKPRVLFAGPPPPIATSTVLRRDLEEGRLMPTPRGAASLARSTLSSVFFDRPDRDASRPPEHETDSAWRNLQRREKALHKDFQQLLDVQAAGLASGTPAPGAARSDASDDGGGSSTPTGTFYSSASRRSDFDVRTRASFAPSGKVIPVRQPRARPMGLRAARAGLARSMAMLSDLKAEEDTALAAAVLARKTALAELRRVSARREGIEEELKALQEDEEEPIARELARMGDEYDAVDKEIVELEARLVQLRNRRQHLKERMDDSWNRREAGLSGYKNALKEADGELASLLKRPPVRPLDTDLFKFDGAAGDATPGGLEFLRLRPERRRPEMVREWWEKEIEMLEKRQAEVDNERAALEQGADLWKGTVKLVTDFEADLRKQMKGEDTPATSKGKSKVMTPEEAMREQIRKMRHTTRELEQKLAEAEDNRWNLLICAIGAEAEAFREGESILREALHGAGFELDDDTPAFHSAVGSTVIGTNESGNGNGASLLDLPDDEKAAESDNEVPHDLLVSHHGHEDHDREPHNEPDRTDSRMERDDSSENEIPPEFLAQHHRDLDLD